jgi:Tol biopolymer transport system component
MVNSVARNNELVRISAAGTQHFASLPDFSYWFRWSPDGKALRFTLGANNAPNSLWELSSSGGNPHRVLPELTGTINQNGNWTPDGKYYLFNVFRQNRMDLWAVREKGDLFHKVDYRPFPLTSGPMSFEGPQPSLDGKRIYVVGDQLRAELVRYDAKSSQFVPYLGGASITDITFSPDGQWTAYVTYPEGVLWRSRIDGSQKLQLTSNVPKVAAHPRWSPDGKQIVFFGWNSMDTGTSALYVISADGGTPRPLAVAQFSAVFPSWMPDGNSVLFSDSQPGLSSTIKVVDLKTLQVTPLSDKQEFVIPTSSPDGRSIAAASADGQKLMVFDVNARKWSELLKMSVGWTTWSPDGKYLYFDTGLADNPAFYRFRLADRKLERLADLKGFRRVILNWIPWSGITPDGSPLLLRDISSQEVYALDFEAP